MFSGIALSTLSMSNREPISTNQAMKSKAQGAAKNLLIGAGALALQLKPAFAVGSSGLEDANKKLSEYGLPPLLFVPPGFTPIVSEFGRGSIREKMNNPVLVQFCHPATWVQQKTVVNKNGESGTIAANDYMKGDSAAFFTVSGASLPSDKKGAAALLLKALSQKGDPVDDLVVKKIEEVTPGGDGQKYLNVDYSYKLNTEAGFIIGRKGVCSMTNVGTATQLLTVALTDVRYKKYENDARLTAESFRVYRLKSGLFSAEGSS